MKAANPLILTLNGGSSSIKFALFEVGEAPRRRVTGAVTGIGLPSATLEVKDAHLRDNLSRQVKRRIKRPRSACSWTGWPSAGLSVAPPGGVAGGP